MRGQPWVLAAVVALATTACSTGTLDNPRSDGPLSLGDTSSRLCVPTDDDTVTVGHRRLTHDGSSPVVITEVTLDSGQNLELIDALLVPRSEDDGYVHVGVGGSYPPKEPDPDLPTGWPDRVEAVGSTIAPGEEYGFAVGLATTSNEDGRAEAVVVKYTDDNGTVYQTTYNTAMVITHGRCKNVKWPEPW